MKGRTRQSRSSRSLARPNESGAASVAVNAVHPTIAPPSAGNSQVAEIAPPFVPGVTDNTQEAPKPIVAGMAGREVAKLPHEPSDAPQASNEGDAQQAAVLPQQNIEQMIGIPGTRTGYEDVVANDVSVSEDDGYKYIYVKINPASQVISSDEQWQGYMSSGWRKVDNHPRECSTLVVMRMPIAQYNKMYEQSEAFYERTIGGIADVIDAPPSDKDDPGCTVKRQLASKETLNDLVDRMPKSVKDLTAERNAVMEAEGLSESDLTDPDDGDG